MRILFTIALATLVVAALAAPQQQQQRQLTPQQRQQLQQRRAQQQNLTPEQRQQLQQRRQQQQNLTPEQRRQLQQRREQQQRQQQQQQQQGAQKPNNDVEVVRGTDGRPLHLDPNLTLSKISQTDLQNFMKDKEAVNQLVICFEELRRCRARAGVSLVRDVRSLGRGGICKKCDQKERENTRKLVTNAISLMQQNHPVEWRRLLPEISFLL